MKSEPKPELKPEPTGLFEAKAPPPGGPLTATPSPLRRATGSGPAARGSIAPVQQAAVGFNGGGGNSTPGDRK